MTMKSKIINSDCIEYLLWSKLPKATMIFADPPDNLGMKYQGFTDYKIRYLGWLETVIEAGIDHSSIFWLSYNYKYQKDILPLTTVQLFDWKQFIWHFSFGQNRQDDFVSSYRPILRLMRSGAKTYPDAVRVPSARQTKYNDKRADPRGRIPDDVWEYPRVCGTFKERKKWHPCQHPKDLLRRLVLFSTRPGDLVIDMFAGSGNMLEVCLELGRTCIAIEISKFYCEKISENTGISIGG